MKIEPLRIIEENDAEVTIEWSDGVESRYNAAALRRSCPCAGCIDEWTGKKLLADDAVPDDIAFRQIAIVGRYALNFQFTDGHDSGIFSFDLLYKFAQS
ncbi:MAG: DUF971 domain-containing protein [Blastocatellia bacterium]|nr:DUF971 domain-containing protein [Blastocatellia bacterium]